MFWKVLRNHYYVTLKYPAIAYMHEMLSYIAIPEINTYHKLASYVYTLAIVQSKCVDMYNSLTIGKILTNDLWLFGNLTDMSMCS